MATVVDSDAPKGAPAANVYTVLVIIAILVLGTTLGLVMKNLTTPVKEGGYGLQFGQMFELPEKPKPPTQ